MFLEFFAPPLVLMVTATAITVANHIVGNEEEDKDGLPNRFVHFFCAVGHSKKQCPFVSASTKNSCSSAGKDNECCIWAGGHVHWLPVVLIQTSTSSKCTYVDRCSATTGFGCDRRTSKIFLSHLRRWALATVAVVTWNTYVSVGFCRGPRRSSRAPCTGPAKLSSRCRVVVFVQTSTSSRYD